MLLFRDLTFGTNRINHEETENHAHETIGSNLSEND